MNLSNNLLGTHINKEGYYGSATTPGLWKHTWRPIQFYLIVDDFGIEYVGGKHAHLLQEHYEISEDWRGEKFSGIDLEWKYPPTHNDRTLRLSIQGYIEIILILFGHKQPTKPQI